MTINNIKLDLEKNKGKVLKFKFNGSRNQTEEFFGRIENLYNYIFVVRLENSSDQIKSFSYEKEETSRWRDRCG